MEPYSPFTCAVFPTFYHKIQILYRELVPVSEYRCCILFINVYIYEFSCIFLWYKNEGFSKNLTFWAQRVSTLLSQGVICAIFVFQNMHRNTQIHWSSRCQTCAIQNGHKNQNGHKPLNFSINNTI